MKVSVLCTDAKHPIIPSLEQWADHMRGIHDVALASSADQLTDGDLLFLVSVHHMVALHTRERFRATLVLHASAVPEGRGWSPLVWQILEGRSIFTVSLLSAEDSVDSGAIWAQRTFTLRGDELVTEINGILFSVELELMDYAVANFESISPKPQSVVGGSYYRRRTPDDSRIDPYRSIAEQFDLLRVADPERYPAFFEYRGCRYKLVVSKAT